MYLVGSTPRPNLVMLKGEATCLIEVAINLSWLSIVAIYVYALPMKYLYI